MTQALAFHGLAIEEPPLTPGPTPGVAALPRLAESAATEGLLRFNERPAAPSRVQVTLRLTDGERIAVASFDTQEAAKQHAQVLTEEIGTTRDWLFLSGRFVRPDAIVSVDLDTAV